MCCMDAMEHVHCVLIGGMLDTEGLRSWSHADSFLRETIPEIDSLDVAMKGVRSDSICVFVRCNWPLPAYV